MIVKNKYGIVFLIGAGPGDPGLITVKGLECIKNADVVIYDYLASPKLLKYAREKVELIYVGKKEGDHTFSQDAINRLIIEKAKEGKKVARVKGGDPFIFGRGAEEAEILSYHGIKFEVIPGITSGISAASYAGIPLTHRKYTSDVTFVTGHEDPLKKNSNINWKVLAESNGTIVFFMGVKNLINIVKKLKANGKTGETPVAVVRWGTTPKQVTLVGTLDTILDKCNDVNIKPPSIIVAGEVVKLREKISWFENNRPLLGKSIVVTRARAQASKLVDKLDSLGSNCIECPTIKVIEPIDWSLVDDVIFSIKDYKWFIFTSVNGVSFFFKRLFYLNMDVRILSKIKIVAIGPSTEQELLNFGLKCDIVPETYCAESILEAFSDENIKGERICLPRAAEARPMLPIELSKRGALVKEVVVYRTVKSEVNANYLINKLKKREIDLITFTSSSTVNNFVEMISSEEMDALLKGVLIASIGPITTSTAKKLGLEVNITARHYTINGLIESILNYYFPNKSDEILMN